MCSIEIDECCGSCPVFYPSDLSRFCGDRILMYLVTSAHCRANFLVRQRMRFIARYARAEYWLGNQWPIWREVLRGDWFADCVEVYNRAKIACHLLMFDCYFSMGVGPMCNRLWCLSNGKSNLLRAFSPRELSARQTMACCFERGNLFQQYLSNLWEESGTTSKIIFN